MTREPMTAEEAAGDALRMSDLKSYLAATGHDARISYLPKGSTLIDEVKMHAFRIKHLLECMAKCAKTDDVIVDRVAKTYIEVAMNLLRIVAVSFDNLPITAGRSSLIEVEMMDLESKESPPEQVNKPRAKPKAKASCWILRPPDELRRAFLFVPLDAFGEGRLTRV